MAAVVLALGGGDLPPESASPQKSRQVSDASLIDPTFLFRFQLALRHHPLRWGPSGLTLPESCRLPSWASLAGRSVFCDLRIAWGEAGIGVWMRASGKKQLPWCRTTRMEESDGLHLMLDTRSSPGIHRATRYCHHFIFTPIGGGLRRDEPAAGCLPIHRARQNPNPVAAGTVRVHAAIRRDGYELSGLIPAAALTGFDPSEYPQVSLWYGVVDRERGWQTLSLGPEFPVREDPSLWAAASLERPEN